jgi:ubiquitin-protein ligase
MQIFIVNDNNIMNSEYVLSTVFQGCEITLNTIKINAKDIEFNLTYVLVDKLYQFGILTDNIQNVILYNSLLSNTQYLEKDLAELYSKITDVANNIYLYCIGCYKKIDFQAHTFVACGSDVCVNKYEELLIGNPVTNLINKDADIFKFLINSGFKAILSSRKTTIFEPFPTHFLINKNISRLARGELSALSGTQVDNNKDFGKLQAIANKNTDDLVNFVTSSGCSDDSVLYSQSGIWDVDTYLLVRFIILSCKVDINYDLALSEHIPTLSKTVKLYRILHSSIKEGEFTNMKGNKPTFYLYHGSKRENWFSIVRNGLKICSGTKLMTTGAAYGTGIYFSDSSTFSHSYGNSGSESYIGVFEIIGEKKDYLKSTNIYVVNNDKIVILRYLILFSSNKNTGDDLKLLDSLFNTLIYEKKNNMVQGISNKGLQKLVKEYKLIKRKVGGSNSEEKFGFRIDVNAANMYLWKLFLFNYDKESKICKDMEKLKIKEIEMEAMFPAAYPFAPPFIRVVKPRFKHLTGHVTREGALCMQILTDKYWDPACAMESLLITIKSEMLAGGGEIDPVNYHIPYSEESARRSFDMVAKSHGWM